MRPTRLVILVMIALALAGCWGRGGARPAAVPAMTVVPAVPVAAEAPYALDAGDRLRVVVFGQDGLSNSYAVDAGGNVTLPLIGTVPARGLTPRQLSASIAERLRRGYIREPHVAVEIETYRPFFILGEVTAPGQYPYVPNMTVETAVAIAGGFTPRASHRGVRLSRTVDGLTTRAAVPPVTLVRPGDTITVEERWF
jgi:polysaccharide export outer membrane protein